MRLVRLLSISNKNVCLQLTLESVETQLWVTRLVGQINNY